MKKLYFAAIAVLLALVIVSCDNIGKPETGRLNDDGTVTLDLGSGNLGRALVGTTAKAGTTFLEASFKNIATSTIVRTTWSWATIGKIRLVPGTYQVILFAGRGSDKTLLGVGRVTEIDDSGSASATITAGDPVPVVATTTGLHFSVEPLTNGITNSDATSTFYIGTPVPSDPVISPYMRDDFGNNIPVFEVTKGGTSTATWKFDIGSSNLSLYAPDIVIAGTGVALQTGHSSKDALDVPQTVTFTTLTPVSGPVTGTFGFSITAPNADGAAYIALEVPVAAFDATSATVPVTWYIRGGLNNSLLDAGPAPSGGTPTAPGPGILGGAIVVFFGSIDAIPELILYYEYP